MYDLGALVFDRITGFRGRIIAKTVWYEGTTRYGVQSTALVDGKILEPEWLDEGRLEAQDDFLES